MASSRQLIPRGNKLSQLDIVIWHIFFFFFFLFFDENLIFDESARGRYTFQRKIANIQNNFLQINSTLHEGWCKFYAIQICIQKKSFYYIFFFLTQRREVLCLLHKSEIVVFQ